MSFIIYIFYLVNETCSKKASAFNIVAIDTEPLLFLKELVFNRFIYFLNQTNNSTTAGATNNNNRNMFYSLHRG